jgi:hypothetical protein
LLLFAVTKLERGKRNSHENDNEKRSGLLTPILTIKNEPLRCFLVFTLLEMVDMDPKIISLDFSSIYVAAKL